MAQERLQTDPADIPTPDIGTLSAHGSIRWWLRGEARQNFGDFLSAFIATRALQPEPRVAGTHYYLLGSTLEYWVAKLLLEQAAAEAEQPHLVFWGCGMRNEHPPTPEQRAQLTILGVRGPLSRQYMSLPEDTAIGDPALLLPSVYRPQADPNTEGRAICVPHFGDNRDDETLLAISGAEMVLRPNIEASAEALFAFIDALTSARFALCGAMHAAVVQAAYGRPFGFWDNGHLDVPFKWRDFAASVSIPSSFVDTVAAGEVVYDHIFAPRLRLPDLRPLLNIAPFAPRTDIFEAAAIGTSS